MIVLYLSLHINNDGAESEAMQTPNPALPLDNPRLVRILRVRGNVDMDLRASWGAR